MEKMIAYCGLLCTDCPAFIATLKDDNAERAKVAEEWSKTFAAELKPEDINCDGCLSTGGREFSHCKVCEIRKCARERNLENCAHCGDYPCSTVSGVLDAVPEAKRTLDEIRSNLGL